MQLPVHAATSAVLCGAVYAATGSQTAAAASWLSGVFIDLDHVADYLAFSGERFSIARFFSWCEEDGGRAAVFWLHSWELLVLLLMTAAWLRADALFGLVLGAGVHLAMDQVGNRRGRSVWYYFLGYRWLTRPQRLQDPKALDPIGCRPLSRAS